MERLNETAAALGLSRPPIWAVLESDEVNAMAIGGIRGVVVFHSAMLKQFPPAELLAVAGHELSHIRSRDSLPALVGGSWMSVVGRLSGFLSRAGERSTHWVIAIVSLLGLLLEICLVVVGWVAEAVLSKRSRLAEHVADMTGARVTSAGTMIAALSRLEAIKPARESGEPRWSPLWIAQRLHASHPPREARIAYLQRAAERGEVSA